MRSYLESVYDPNLYEIVENRTLVNAQGRTIRVEVRGRLTAIRPDFQIFNRASGRIVGVYEAKIGQLTYLKGRGGEALFRIQQAAARLGYETPPVTAVYQLSSRIREAPARVSNLSRLGRVVSVFSALVFVLGIAADVHEQQELERQLQWLRENDPVFYSELQCELGLCA